jgi:NADH-quinone oxidoreductase subunit A
VSANPYVPILILFAIGFGFAAFSVGIAAITGPARYNRAKQEAYECGIEPSPQALEGGRFPVKYFLTAMLFIVFDIEIVFLYPWAVTFDQLGLFGLVEMAIFIGTVLSPLHMYGDAADWNGIKPWVLKISYRAEFFSQPLKV